ncbi:MAG: hypothetical protein ACK4K7_15535 [Allosphingosinicella sp.]|uniref:hypothetical protein n=1 Tax=Allosphingosinicella sp. TaxID=2823234 RepID=UPI003929FA03
MATGRHGDWAEKLTLASLALGVLHHVDHALRVDHSGWPFRPDVTPYTYSLAAYPLLLFALLAARASDWWRFAAVAVVALFTNLAHILFESPYHQFAMWAHNASADPAAAGTANMLDVASPALGVAAVVVAMGLNLTLIGAAVAFFLRARRRSG